MPHFLRSLKTILPLNTSSAARPKSSCRFASFVLLFSLLGLIARNASAFNPFSLKQEFENKLNSQALLSSTKYYARGATYQAGQIWNEVKFLTVMKQNNYRLRTSDQTLMNGDSIKLASEPCRIIIQQDIPPESECWLWKTEKNESNLIQILNNVTVQTFQGDPLQPSLQTGFDPILVAQYRNNEPIMQQEVKIADIPVNCMNAVIAIEDNDFLDHSGVSYTGTARAFVKNVLTFRKAQGGSTITQQLVKNYFLTPEKTFSRKLKEMYMAIRLESQWTKDEILQTYLNIIYMGQAGAFQIRGFAAASQSYFNKPVQNLNLSECALLAAIINNPGQNHPWRKTEKAQGRRKLVLSKMKELSLITEGEFTTADAFAMPKPIENKATETAPYFFEAVRRQAQDAGFKIDGNTFYTSLDLAAQDQAQRSLQKGIQQTTEARKGLKSNKEKGLELQGVVMTAENASGYVTAFVGGQSFKQTQFNRALNSHRQIGSLIKPIVYLSGMLYGFKDDANVNPLTTLEDAPFSWPYEKKSWKPENYDRKFRGPVPYYYALKESLNVPTAQVAFHVGLDKIIDTAQKLGLKSKIEMYPSSSLGASQHYPIEILQAYHTLANFGALQNLSFIESIVDSEGNNVYIHEIKKLSQFDPINVAVLVGMMKQTLISGTAKSSKAFGFTRPAAGKTGTTSDGKDVWFAGFTPYLTSVVWLGFDQNISTHLTGASGALPIWMDYMKFEAAQYQESDFTWPENVEIKEVSSDLVNETVPLVFKK